jgi:hypothetical protein
MPSRFADLRIASLAIVLLVLVACGSSVQEEGAPLPNVPVADGPVSEQGAACLVGLTYQTETVYWLPAISVCWYKLPPMSCNEDALGQRTMRAIGEVANVYTLSHRYEPVASCNIAGPSLLIDAQTGQAVLPARP